MSEPPAPQSEPARTAQDSHPPPPIGSGAGSLTPAQRKLAGRLALAAVAFVAACLALGWNRPTSLAAMLILDALAGLLLAAFLATIWIGEDPATTPNGFQIGDTAYLSGPAPSTSEDGGASRGPAPESNDATRSTGTLIKCLRILAPKPLRTSLFLLPVAVPFVCAAATFASVPHQVQGDFYTTLEPTLIAVLGASIGVKGFLAVRSHRRIDFIGALLATAILTAGIVLSLVEIAANSKHELRVQWAAAAFAFGMVVLLQSVLRGADAPAGTDDAATANALPSASQPQSPPPPAHMRCAHQRQRQTGCTQPTSPTTCVPQGHPPCLRPPPDMGAGARRALLLTITGALVLVAIGLLLLLPPLTASATTGESIASQLALAGLVVASVCVGGALLSEQPTRWLAAAVVSGAVGGLFTVGVALAQANHKSPPSRPDCLATAVELDTLADDEPHAAERLALEDAAVKECGLKVPELARR